MRLGLLPLLVLLALPSGVAHGESSAEIGGYVAPSFGITYRPTARPVDRTALGCGHSAAGLRFISQPADHWRFTIDLIIGAEVFEALTGVEAVDVDNDGEIDAMAVTVQEAIGSLLEEATVTWDPADAFDLRVGQMRIPFTSQAQSHDMTLMFPTRSGPNEMFLRGTDLGLLAQLTAGDEQLLGSVGVFNGTGLAADRGNVKGVLVAGRLDMSPLGAFEFAESDLGREAFRFGLGAGVLYNPYRSHDSAGEVDVAVTDIRASFSLRMAVRGFFFSAEALLRRQTDSLTSRPVQATGAYGQLGFFIPAGVEPVARVGWTAEDQSFDARHTLWLEGGVNLYPAHRDEVPDSIKISVNYLGEGRLTEREWAHGGVARVQLKF